MDYTIASDFHENVEALRFIFENYNDTQIVLLGDYFDSLNPKSNAKDMADLITDFENGKFHFKYQPLLVRGNHDDALLGAANMDIVKGMEFLQHGGSYTLQDLGFYIPNPSPEDVASFLQDQYPEVLDFIQKHEYVIEHENIIFVHGGLDLDTANPVENTTHEDMMWLRNQYYFEEPNWKNPKVHAPKHNTTNKSIISGHTPVEYLNADKSANILLLQNPNDKPGTFRAVIDGGSNSGEPEGRVNIVKIHENGELFGFEYVPDNH